jgi:hypothetical protein
VLLFIYGSEGCIFILRTLLARYNKARKVWNNMHEIDTNLADLKARKQGLQLQLNEINTQMSNIRARYSERLSNSIFKPNRSSKDVKLRKLQSEKEHLQPQIQALQAQIIRIQALKRAEKQIQTQNVNQQPQDQNLIEEKEVELIRVRCTQGKLIVSNKKIAIELTGFGQIFKSQSLLRSSLTSIDNKLVAMPIFGMGGGTNLAFHGKGGEILNASLVPPKEAQKIVELLS